MSTPAVRSADLSTPPLVERYGNTALIAGVVGLLLTGVGAALDFDQFFRSYLLGFLFWTGVGMGCISILLIHHLTGGMWGLVIRRVLEAGARTMPLCFLLFLPLLFGLPRLYEWADGARVAADPVLRHKSLYLNIPFFVGRGLFYFAVWCGLSVLLDRGSLKLDALGGKGRGYYNQAQTMRGLGGGGLLLMGLTITFSSIDWAMSLDPHWFSTVYGVLFMVGTALSAMALMILMVALLGREEPLARVVLPSHVHDLGKLLFAFVMLWAYINVSQWIIIWSGNLPEETPWYLRRLRGGWQYVSLGIVVFHFFLPFLLLLSRGLKRDARRLALVAGLILAVRVIDLFWMLAPDAPIGHEATGFHLHWMDVTAVVGVGGTWLWYFARALRSRPLLTVGEPDLRERMVETRLLETRA